MPEYEPLTKGERDEIDEHIALMFRAYYGVITPTILAGYVRRYEATVSACEVEIARLRPDAETGEAVEGMGVDTMLWRTVIGWRYLCGVDDLDWPEDYRAIIQALLPDGETFELSLHDSALAALRAAKGE